MCFQGTNIGCKQPSELVTALNCGGQLSELVTALNCGGQLSELVTALNCGGQLIINRDKGQIGT